MPPTHDPERAFRRGFKTHAFWQWGRSPTCTVEEVCYCHRAGRRQSETCPTGATPPPSRTARRPRRRPPDSAPRTCPRCNSCSSSASRPRFEPAATANRQLQRRPAWRCQPTPATPTMWPPRMAIWVPPTTTWASPRTPSSILLWGSPLRRGAALRQSWRCCGTQPASSAAT
jgi:hypothetical protein